MPNLKDLIFDMFLNRITDNKYTNFGRILGYFKNNINLHLSVSCDKTRKQYSDKFSLIDWLYRYGLLQFVVDLESTILDYYETKASKLINLRGVKFEFQRDRNISTNITFAPFFIADAPITYLDLTEYNIPQVSWVPPTVKILKCRINCLMPRRNTYRNGPPFSQGDEDIIQEDKKFQVYDNVSSLTIMCSAVSNNQRLNSQEFYFRKLTELHLRFEDRGRSFPSGTARHFYCGEVIRSLLNSNSQSLVSLKIGPLYQDELEVISDNLQMVEILDIELLHPILQNESSTELVSKIMSSWGPNLRQHNYKILRDSPKYHIGEIDQTLPLPEPWVSIGTREIAQTRSWVHIGYNELRSQVLAHPNLQFNGVQFPSDSRSIESTLFGNTFKESRDGQCFDFTDFCECADPSLFDNDPPVVNVFMDCQIEGSC